MNYASILSTILSLKFVESGFTKEFNNTKASCFMIALSLTYIACLMMQLILLLSSWLHQNATVTTVESTDENILQVSAVISMTNV